MNLIFFVHPAFTSHQSMPRFANMLAEGMKQRGHTVNIWSPTSTFNKLPGSEVMKKWLGYIDQFIVFPFIVRRRIKALSPDTLFVFTDHALGPWVPLVSDRLHVIHCHDFLAQQSAAGEIPENITRWSGRQYQQLIWRGYSKGKNFISVSLNTRSALQRFLPTPSQRSEMVYNGLNQRFEIGDSASARKVLGRETERDLNAGYILHVGGNQWYKNREGVVDIYEAWRARQHSSLPLLLIGEIPNYALREKISNSPFKSDIHALSGASDKVVREAYVGASVLLFPSKAEGFGWPIAEAMASGCPVITTNEPPMSEVAGKAGFLISRQPYHKSEIAAWAFEGSEKICEVLKLSDEERKSVIEQGLQNAKRFDTKIALDRIEEIYKNIVQQGKTI